MPAMTNPADRPGYSFDPGPPPEVSRFFRNKGVRDSFSFEDIEPEEHAVAFSVAKATKADVLTDIRDAVQKAIDEGQTLDQFRKGLTPTLQAKGWWGRQLMGDPQTGELEVVRLGSPRRLRTIYDANLRSARAAGQWERIERTKKMLPFLEYRLGPSEHHRPAHEAKDGLILGVDDPFWDAWLPPNGWGCKCWVRQITKAEAVRRGVSAAPEVPAIEHVNKRTGEVRQVPAGIDPSWDRNPGKLRQQNVQRILAAKIDQMPTDMAEAAVKDIATSWQAERLLAGKSPGAVPIGVLPRALAEEVGSRTRVVMMGQEYGRKFVAKQRGVTPEVLLELVDAMSDGTIFASSAHDPTELTVISKTEKPWAFILKVMQKEGEIWVKTFKPAKPNWVEQLRANERLVLLRE